MVLRPHTVSERLVEESELKAELLAGGPGVDPIVVLQHIEHGERHGRIRKDALEHRDGGPRQPDWNREDYRMLPVKGSRAQREIAVGQALRASEIERAPDRYGRSEGCAHRRVHVTRVDVPM